MAIYYNGNKILLGLKWPSRDFNAVFLFRSKNKIMLFTLKRLGFSMEPGKNLHIKVSKMQLPE